MQNSNKKPLQTEAATNQISHLNLSTLTHTPVFRKLYQLVKKDAQVRRFFLGLLTEMDKKEVKHGPF